MIWLMVKCGVIEFVELIVMMSLFNVNNNDNAKILIFCYSTNVCFPVLAVVGLCVLFFSDYILINVEGVAA